MSPTSQTPHSLEHTTIIDDYVFHYTCNPPSKSILDKYKIQQIGGDYGCRDPREVLMIPINVYKKFNIPVSPADIKITSEQLLRKMGLQKIEKK
jgi:hypothetical protein